MKYIPLHRQIQLMGILSLCVLLAACSAMRTNSGQGQKIIVVSLGKGLDRYGQEIQEALYQALKESGPSSVTLVAIQAGQLGKTLEDFRRNPERRCEEDVTWCWISGNIRFGGEDLDALEDLMRVSEKHPQDRLGSVLYLTDNANMPELNKIRDDAITVPRNWAKNGVELTVLTTGSCRPWDEKARAEKCIELRYQDANEQVRQTLENFM